MRVICIFILLLFFVGCSRNAIQIEDKSIDSGIIGDTIFLNYRLGMSKSDVQWKSLSLKVDNELKEIDGSLMGSIKTDHHRAVYTIEFEYLDDHLYRTAQIISKDFIRKTDSDTTSFESELLNMYSAKYGPARTNGTIKSKFYWVSGNKRIDYFDFNKNYRQSICILATDMVKERIYKHQQDSIMASMKFRNDNMSIEERIANDAVYEYEITERQGDLMQMYTQAGVCCAAFLQCHDEANYDKWKAIEENLANKIGIPVYKK